ncbi:mechanosensitive ion channel family protein [Salinibacterium hongtaonis]|uniref:Mechanosensitive ion channel protein MscS n=1 Tax=Homoserinimonas hongtaonis TaxID=2079791 RepID=A0A2U1SZ86_9MICO|nr:mechanosensitive ion channel domain-containing protein [Salinibacterium hongtaonis]AWB89503.1 mechanosensitive ion channel protein MscS [Salinibacterium hongtaonis]PWB96944.1 mechanosensitive ion channel protein MscS [Salinibacterium hongtaonis]
MEETPTPFDWNAFWAGVGSFIEFWQVPLKVLLLTGIAVAATWVLRLAIRRIVNRVVTGVKKKENIDDTQALFSSPLAAVRVVQRTRALGTVLNSAVTVTIVIITLLLLVDVVFPNATAAFGLLSAAVGAGLGFGAQNIVKDVLNGIFMVAEDQLGVGDVVDLGPATGVVEVVGIRVTQVRDVNGTLWFVRNGEILRVGNTSQGWARAIIDLAVPYDADVDLVQQRILGTAVDMYQNSKWRSRMLDRPEIWGIESISAEAVVVRLVVKTRAASKDDVARELRARLKRTLDEMGVRLPALNSVVLQGFEGATSVGGARPPKTRPIKLDEVKEATAAAQARKTPPSRTKGTEK